MISKPVRKDNKVTPTIMRSYFSFFQGEKTANGAALTEVIENHCQRGNSELFKKFSKKKKWKGEALTEANKNQYQRDKRASQMVGVTLLTFLIQIILIFAFSKIVSAQDYPATEIYLLSIHKKKAFISLAHNARLVNVSNNKGYDNQPSFIEKLNSIAYVSSRAKKPTDVYLYDLTTGNSQQFTNTTEAEFSPKITPDGKYISVVKGAEQNLTKISLDGSITEKLYTSKDSIGYYCWLSDNEIVAVVLTNPVTLKLINIKTHTEKYLADSIGRNLFKYKDGVVVCRILHSGNWITYIDRSGNYTPWMLMPANTEDFYLTSDGWLFSSDGSHIIYCNAKKLAKWWEQLADLKGMGISKIFRLSVNKKKNKLAFVTEDK